VLVPATAAEIGASLLVIGAGDDAWDATTLHDITRRAGCSVLTIPAPVRSVVPTDPVADVIPMRPERELETIGT
jgi:hypothetical protein